MHVIRNTEYDRYKQSTRHSRGAEKWLDVQVHDSTEACLDVVKSLGYKVVATHLRADAIAPAAWDWTQPTAVVFGNEKKGVSDRVLEVADACVAIPMDGFVESFNISVAASLVLWEARRVRQDKVQNLGGGGGGGGGGTGLTVDQIQILKAIMVLRTRGLAKQWISQLLKRPPPEWQRFRGKGDWQGKEFRYGDSDDDYSEEDEGTDGSDNNKTRVVAYQNTRCYFWDGCTCWGEKLFFKQRCRYHEAHHEGVSTLNMNKVEAGCQRADIEVPEELVAIRAAGKKKR